MTRKIKNVKDKNDIQQLQRRLGELREEADAIQKQMKKLLIKKHNPVKKIEKYETSD
jgi:predicted  nucleic acid-binding Zn-ribbon protein